MTKTLIAALSIVALAAPAAHAWTLPANVRVIANSQLPDSAAAMPTPSGPVIVVNPMVLANAPAGLEEFALAHEYGHIVLGHLANPQSQAIPVWAQQLEKEADCYAARVISDDAAATAAAYFERMQGPTSGDARHPSGYERAAVIRACHAEARRADNAETDTDDDITDATDAAPARTCYRTVTTYEPRTVTVMQMAPRCGYVMTPWGPQQSCGMVPTPVQTVQQVPVTHQVPAACE